MLFERIEKHIFSGISDYFRLFLTDALTPLRDGYIGCSLKTLRSSLASLRHGDWHSNADSPTSSPCAVLLNANRAQVQWASKHSLGSKAGPR